MPPYEEKKKEKDWIIFIPESYIVLFKTRLSFMETAARNYEKLLKWFIYVETHYMLV